MSERIPKETFYENLNTSFRVPVEPPQELSLELFEIIEGISSDQHEQFALHFRGPLEMAFRQQIVRLEHDTLGTLNLFLVPIGKQPDCMVYEAVFNRFIKPDKE